MVLQRQEGACRIGCALSRQIVMSREFAESERTGVVPSGHPVLQTRFLPDGSTAFAGRLQVRSRCTRIRIGSVMTNECGPILLPRAVHDSTAASGRGGQRPVSRRVVLKYAVTAPVLLSLGTVAATVDAQMASAADIRLIDFTERLVPPDQIKSAGYRRGVGLCVRVAAGRKLRLQARHPRVRGCAARGGSSRRQLLPVRQARLARRRRTSPAGTTAAWPTPRPPCGCTPRPGVPDSAPIFFSVDEDIDLDTWKSVAVEWFRGINSVLGVDRTGIYGHSAGVWVGDRRRRNRALNHCRILVGMADERMVGW